MLLRSRFFSFARLPRSVPALRSDGGHGSVKPAFPERGASHPSRATSLVQLRVPPQGTASPGACRTTWLGIFLRKQVRGDRAKPPFPRGHGSGLGAAGYPPGGAPPLPPSALTAAPWRSPGGGYARVDPSEGWGRGVQQRAAVPQLRYLNLHKAKTGSSPGPSTSPAV